MLPFQVMGPVKVAQVDAGIHCSPGVPCLQQHRGRSAAPKDFPSTQLWHFPVVSQLHCGNMLPGAGAVASDVVLRKKADGVLPWDHCTRSSTNPKPCTP